MAEYLLDEILLVVLGEVVYARCAPDYRIDAASEGFNRLASQGREALGRNLAEFIDLPSVKAAAESGVETKLTVRSGGDLHTIVCRVREIDTGCVLIGAKAMLSMSGALDGMTKIENQLVALNRKYQAKIAELERANSRIDSLTGLLPICAGCKKIRTEAGEWEEVEVYVGKRSEAEFSHGICPGCMKRLYPEFPE